VLSWAVRSGEVGRRVRRFRLDAEVTAMKRPDARPQRRSCKRMMRWTLKEGLQRRGKRRRLE